MPVSQALQSNNLSLAHSLYTMSQQSTVFTFISFNSASLVDWPTFFFGGGVEPAGLMEVGDSGH